MLRQGDVHGRCTPRSRGARRRFATPNWLVFHATSSDTSSGDTRRNSRDGFDWWTPRRRRRRQDAPPVDPRSRRSTKGRVRARRISARRDGRARRRRRRPLHDQQTPARVRPGTPPPRRRGIYARRVRAAQHADGADGSTASALRPSDRLVLSRKGGAVVVGRVVVSEVRETSEGAWCWSSRRSARCARRVRARRPRRTSGESTETTGAVRCPVARAALVSAFASTEPRAASLRRRLFDLEPPSFDVDAATRALERVSPEGKAALAALNDEQRAAVKHVLAARDYAIVAGLPGAGKSATLAAIVRALVDLGKSVLITSHTHNAVDNILERLPGVGVDEYLRVGGEEGKASAETATRTPGGERHRAKTVTELAKLADAARVVGATCYAVANNPMIIRRRSGRGDGSRGSAVAPDGHFDVVLVDEAGQMTLPSSVPPLLRGSVFVLVGDPHQLPPLVQSKRAQEGDSPCPPCSGWPTRTRRRWLSFARSIAWRTTWRRSRTSSRTVDGFARGDARRRRACHVAPEGASGGRPGVAQRRRRSRKARRVPRHHRRGLRAFESPRNEGNRSTISNETSSCARSERSCRAARIRRASPFCPRTTRGWTRWREI